MAEDNGLYIPLEDFLKHVHRHELISLGLPTTQVYEIGKINDSEFPIAKPVLLPLPKLPAYCPPNSTTGSHPPFLSSGSTESTSRSELSNNEDWRLSAGIQRATNIPSNETSFTTRKPYCCTQGCHIWFERKEDWKRHEELHFPQAHWICCTKEFARLDEWREHQRSIHKSNPSLSEIESARKLPVSKFPKNCDLCSCEITGLTEWTNHHEDHFFGKIPGVSNRREVLPPVEDTDGDRGSFLQTARGESESIANHHNDPQTSDNGAAGVWLAGVHVRVVQSLLDRVNNLLHRGHPSESQPSTSQSSSSKAASSGTLRGSTSSGNSSNRVRKGRRKTNNSPDEDSEEERSDQETPRKSAQGDLTRGIEFACPYYKANPERPHPKRCERGSWKTISRLKYEHLQRHHRVQANTISDEALVKLCESLGKKGNLTLEDKWGAIYHVLFPEAMVIPCPYYGIDWPPPIENTSLATSEASFSQQQGTPLQSDLPCTEEALQSAILTRGFFPAVMTNIRCMLENEERLHQERIKARLPAIVSETYWNFVSTLNQESSEGRRNDNSESAGTWHPVASDTPVFHEPMKDDGASSFGVINPTHPSATYARGGAFAKTPHLPQIHAIPDTAKDVQYNSDARVSNDIVVSFDPSQAPGPGGVGEEQGKYSHPMPQMCGDPTQHSHFIDPQGNHCYLCQSLAFPLIPTR